MAKFKVGDEVMAAKDCSYCHSPSGSPYKVYRWQSFIVKEVIGDNCFLIRANVGSKTLYPAMNPSQFVHFDDFKSEAKEIVEKIAKKSLGYKSKWISSKGVILRVSSMGYDRKDYSYEFVIEYHPRLKGLEGRTLRMNSEELFEKGYRNVSDLDLIHNNF